MYIHGMRGMGQDYPEYESYPSPQSTGFELPDWGGAIETAIKTWGNYETAKVQAEASKAQAAQPPRYPYPYSPASAPYGGYSPFPSTGAGVGGILLIGAAAVAAYFIIKN